MPISTMNPATLIGGALGAPIVLNALGRTFITFSKEKMTEEQANAEWKRLHRNFVIYNAVGAVGLGLVGTRAGLSEGWKTAALGGAMGMGLVAALLGGAMLMAPTVEEAKVPAGGFGGGFGGGQLGAGNGAASSQSWSSMLLGQAGQAR